MLRSLIRRTLSTTASSSSSSSQANALRQSLQVSEIFKSITTDFLLFVRHTPKICSIPPFYTPGTHVSHRQPWPRLGHRSSLLSMSTRSWSVRVPCGKTQSNDGSPSDWINSLACSKHIPRPRHLVQPHHDHHHHHHHQHLRHNHQQLQAQQQK